MIGAEALKKMLVEIDLEEEREELRIDMKLAPKLNARNT